MRLFIATVMVFSFTLFGRLRVQQLRADAGRARQFSSLLCELADGLQARAVSLPEIFRRAASCDAYAPFLPLLDNARTGAEVAERWRERGEPVLPAELRSACEAVLRRTSGFDADGEAAQLRQCAEAIRTSLAERAKARADREKLEQVLWPIGGCIAAVILL